MNINEELQKGINEHKKGNIQEAEKIYRSILNVQPNNPDANHNLGLLAVYVKKNSIALPLFKNALIENPKIEQYWISYIDALIKEKKFNDAESLLKQANENGLRNEKFKSLNNRLVSAVNNSPLPESEVQNFFKFFNDEKYNEAEKIVNLLFESHPNNKFCWKMILLIYRKKNDTNNILASHQKIAQLDPYDSENYNDYAVVLQKNGKIERAEEFFRKAIKLNSEFKIAYANLANLLSETNRLEEAESIFREIFKKGSDIPDIYNNFGLLLNKLGKKEEAKENYIEALKINPNFPEAYNNLANILKNERNIEDAIINYKKAIDINPNYADAYNNLAMTYADTGELEEALQNSRKALKIKPNFIEANNNVGLTLMRLNKLKEAESCYQKSIIIDPNNFIAHNNLGIILRDLGKLKEAEVSFKKVINLNSKSVEAYNNLAMVYRNQGRYKEAEKLFKDAIKIDPDFLAIYSNLLFLKSSQADDPKKHIEDAREYGKILSDKVTSPFSEWNIEENPKKLRIGFVSGDFRNHPVGYFLQNLVENLQSKSIELYGYTTRFLEDDLTKSFKESFFEWRQLANKDDEEAANLIHNDGIHILFDLSGHTDGNRLPIFAWKPAPIQVSWLGYWATTGVNEIDYILGDPYVMPKKESHHFTEKIWHLPESFLCMTEPKNDLKVEKLPALSNNFITFGCFNNIAKMTDEVIEVRSKILKAVPNSKLLLKSKELGITAEQKIILNRFLKFGIPKDRLIFEKSSQRNEYFKSYNNIDIALSPFPYGGVTTSIEGLWMGVPVLSKKGDKFISHVGETIAYNCGLENWIANSDDEYISKAIEFSADLKTLSNLRKVMREKVLNSPIFNSKRFSRNFEKGLWDMWKKNKIKKKHTTINKKNTSVPSKERLLELLKSYEDGNIKQTINLAKEIINQFPKHPFSWQILGLAYDQNNQLEDSLEANKKFADLDSKNPDAHYNYANSLKSNGKLKEAENAYKRALKLKPDLYSAYNNLANTLRELNKLEEAIIIYKQSIKINPRNSFNVHNNLGISLRENGQLNEAVKVFENAIKSGFKEEELYKNYAIILRDLYRYEESEESYKNALKLNPKAFGIYNDLANVLQKQGKIEESIQYYKKGIAFKPDYALAYNNLGVSYRLIGEFENAEKSYIKAKSIDHDFLAPYSNLLFLKSSQADDPKKHIEDAREFGKILSDKVTSPFSEWNIDENPKKLRIGFVSGDFRHHPVGHFIEHLVKNLEISSIELYGYTNTFQEDDLTKNFKEYFSVWKQLADKDDEEAANIIHNDNIHILIDLSGHTNGNRLPVFAWKPAPIQVSWLGYWATTGVNEIDYILGDPYVMPKEEAHHFTEKIWHLPDIYSSFTKPIISAEVNSLPALSNNFITFGCFNNIAKMTDEVIKVRSKILKAVPNSKLFLKSSQLNSKKNRIEILNRFSQFEISSENLLLEGSSPYNEYFKSYNKVDIALSPFPYGGATTSIEGLWMGVPALTRKGNHLISHYGESIAYNCGLKDWVVDDDDEYISKAIELSMDIKSLSELREGLRKKVLNSPIFDAERFSKNFEKVLWDMWKISRKDITS